MMNYGAWRKNQLIEQGVFTGLVLLPSPASGRRAGDEGVRQDGRQKRIVNYFHHNLSFGQHLIIPKPQYGDPLRTQPCIATLIVINRIRVLATVKLNAQSFFVAIEIEDISSDRVLAAKLRAGKTAIA